VPDDQPFDPIAEAFHSGRRAGRSRRTTWPPSPRSCACSSLLLARVEDALKPYGLTFAAYETLRLLAFTRSGSLPMGKMGVRLMVHPAAVTNAVGKLEQRGLVQRQMSPTTGASSSLSSPTMGVRWPRRRPAH